MTTQARRYQGKLFFDAHDHLEVSAFIVRDKEIGFQLASVSKTYGRWIAESGKVAIQEANGEYRARGVQASQAGTPASSPWDIVFRIDFEDPSGLIEVSGELLEAGESYSFEGELEAI